MFIKRIKHILSHIKADVLYITSPENLRYYSGFTGGEGAIVLSSDRLVLLTDSRYTLQAGEEAKDFEIINVAEEKPLDHLASLGIKTLAFEEGYLSAKAYIALCEALPDCDFVGADSEILKQRSIKDEQEQALTRKASRLACQAFDHVLPLLKPGVRELDIAMELEWFMKKGGASGASFPIICASGPRSAMPHGVASEKKLAKGDFVTLDFGCFVGGYASDMTRTVVLGNPTDEQRHIYNIVLEAQMRAVESIRAGVTGKEADAVARDIIEKAGYGKQFGHSLGHGTGLLIHEQPNLSPRSETVLESGMIVSVEPGIYVDGFGGVRIEDLVIVTEDGCENLVTAEKTLMVL